MELETNPQSQASERAYTAAPSTPVRRTEHAEDQVTRLIEQQSAKIPSNVFLAAAFLAMGTSIALELTGQERWARFFGMWPGPLLTMGVYNKLVKTFGA